MSRYIDADKTLAYISRLLGGLPLALLIECEKNGIDIVRCKECKRANTEDCSHSYWDDDWGEWRVGYRGDEWFCADGEREGE